jgi:hypothetical protein
MNPQPPMIRMEPREADTHCLSSSMNGQPSERRT